MAATISYQSLRSITPSEDRQIRDSIQSYAKQRSWLSCEPVTFFEHSADGTLQGASKPNFEPIKSAPSDLPDGNAADMVEVLCQISKSFNLDWEVVLEGGQPSGYIRDGVPDESLTTEIRLLVQFIGMATGSGSG
jgi:hypothetical protein